MKLTRVHVKNFQSVRNSNPFDIQDITCLVGKNEAGKTAILQALYRLNPIDANEGKYDVTDDFPRTEVTAYKQKVAAGQAPAIVIEATFKLEAAEIGTLEQEFGEGVVPGNVVTLSKGYNNELYYLVAANDTIAGNQLLQKAGLKDEIEKSGKPWNSLKDLAKVLDARAVELERKYQEQAALANTKSDANEKAAALKDAERSKEAPAATKLRERLKTVTTQGLNAFIYVNYFQPHFPKFLYFDEYYQMRGCENIQALQQRVASSNLQRADHPLLGLIQLASLKLEDLLNPSRTRELLNQLEGAGNHLSRQILKYWSQNKHLRLEFDVREARPGDPTGMQSGNNIWSFVYDSKHQVTTDLGVRSRGFVWFFSFLAWYSRLRSSNEKLILLLDEPGLYLHAKAQEDLLRYFEAELKPTHQVIYTTHSPFMVDSNHFDRVRIVQDLSIDADEELPPEQEGTKIIVDVLEATKDSLFPLQGALGYEIYQTLFIGPNSLVVEGVSDLLYLQAMSGLASRSGRVSLDARWTITPVGGADKIPTFVALIGSQKAMNVATLMDFQKRHKQMVENLFKKKLLDKSHVLTFATFTGKSEADIEDMFDSALYVELVNAEFAKELQAPIDATKLNPTVPRILVAIEEHLKSSPLKGGAAFNHYRPARYFVENLSTLSAQVSGTTLTRFEDSFKALNKLIPA
ncbi:MAG: ATP-dependent nuclease [Candidatus Acidiferrales bacterium]